MEKVSAKTKEVSSFDISVLINNTALVESIDNKSGLYNIKTNKLIGMMDNYRTIYNIQDMIYVQVKEKEDVEDIGDFRYIRIYDAKEEKITDQTEETTTQDKTKKSKEKQPKQGNSFLKQLYIDQGYDGIVKMLQGVKNSLGGFFGKLYRNIVIDELYLTMITVGNDAADTALKHGKLCAWAYPILGKLISTCKVKKYNFDFTPDFIGVKSNATAYVRLHLTPIKLTNSVVVLAVQLVFKVLFKLLFAKKKSDKSKVIKTVATDVIAEAEVEAKNNNKNINKDGATK